MYTSNKMPSYNGLGATPTYDTFNPPDYWNRMITDPTQIPYQLYPGGGGYAYGAGGYPILPYGPYPGFLLGSRILTAEDAERIARERQEYAERRAAVTDQPEHKYLTPEGRLNPKLAHLMQAAKEEEKRKKVEKEPDIIGGLRKKILTTVLIGAIISALLR